MSYKILTNQNRVPAGKVRYEFYCRVNGIRYRETIICTRSIVAKKYAFWVSKIDKGELELKDYKFFEILDQYLDYAKDTKSSQHYSNECRTVRLLKKFYKDMRLLDFKRYHVQEYIAWRRKNPLSENLETVSTATINREVSTISFFFNYCIEREYYSRVNPAYRMKLKEFEREIDISNEQVTELLDKAESQGREIYTVVSIAIHSGLRRGEILTLAWSDIDFSKSLIKLKAKNTKGKKRRLVFFTDELKAHLLEVKKENPFSERVMQGWKTSAKLICEWEKLRDKLSFKILSDGLQLHFHDLRHCYGQTLRDCGVPLEDIQVLLGHSNIETTERYATFGGRVDMIEKVNRLSNVIPLRRKAV